MRKTTGNQTMNDFFRPIPSDVDPNTLVIPPTLANETLIHLYYITSNYNAL